MEIVDKHDYFTYDSDCATCKWLIMDGRRYPCKAFPKGVPVAIFSGAEKHREVLRGQTGNWFYEKHELYSNR